MHHKFKLGTAWWVLYNSQESCEKYSDTLILPEQINKCLGVQWNKNIELHFPDLRFNGYNTVLFATVKISPENNGYRVLVSYPTVGSIIDRK